MKTKKTNITTAELQVKILTALTIALWIAFCGYLMFAVIQSPKTEMKIDTNHLYAKSGEVIAVNPYLDTMTFADKNGNIWEVFGSEDWMVQDRLCAIFDDQGTLDPLDDTVIKVTYEAWDW